MAAAFKTAQVGASADKNRARMRDRLPLTVLLTLALVAISAPHTAEDFRFGAFAKAGVDPVFPAVSLGVVYALQLAGAFLAGRRQAVGLVCLMIAGLIWCMGALWLHGPEITASGEYRYGAISKALEIAIIALGAAIALCGWLELRRSAR